MAYTGFLKVREQNNQGSFIPTGGGVTGGIVQVVLLLTSVDGAMAGVGKSCLA